MSGKTSHSHTYNPHTVPVTEAGSKCELAQWSLGICSTFSSSVLDACTAISPFPCPSGPNLYYWGGVTQATNKISPWWYYVSFQHFQVLLSFCLLTHSLYQGLSHSVFVCIVLSAMAHYIQSPNSLLKQGCEVPMTKKKKNFLKVCNITRKVLNVRKIKYFTYQHSPQF